MKVQNPSGFVRFFIVIGAIMKENLLIDKSLAFASRIIKLYQYLTTAKQELVISKQIVRSGTSIGANIAESRAAISRADFVSKLYIAAKECRETQYWIELLYKTEYLNEKQYLSIKEDSEEIGKILSSITKKMKPNNNQ